MSIFLRIATSNNPKYKYYLEFKERLPYLSEEEINEYYSILADTFVNRDTDLNAKCIKRIIRDVKGATILDAAAGTGFLARKLASTNSNYTVTALDIVDRSKNKHGHINNLSFCVGSLTNIPFPDNSFDTVICTHALEHIKDVESALNEIRRVCKKRLIIVLPRQREYKWTFDLHINFFPYKYKVELLIKNKNAQIELIDGDWYIIEDIA